MSFQKCFQDKPYFHIVFQKWFSKSELFFQRKPMKPIIFKIKNFLKLLGFSVPRKMLLQKHMKFPSEKYLFKNQRILPFENGFPKHMEYSSWKLPWKSPWNFHHWKWFSEKPMEFFSWKLLCKTYTIFIIENNFKKNHGIFHLES